MITHVTTLLVAFFESCDSQLGDDRLARLIYKSRLKRSHTQPTINITEKNKSSLETWYLLATKDKMPDHHSVQNNISTSAKPAKGDRDPRTTPITPVEYMLCRHALFDANKKPMLEDKNNPIKCMLINAVATTACVACRADLPSKDDKTDLSSLTPVLLMFSGVANAPWFCGTCGAVIICTTTPTCPAGCGLKHENGLKIFPVLSTLDPSH